MPMLPRARPEPLPERRRRLRTDRFQAKRPWGAIVGRRASCTRVPIWPTAPTNFVRQLPGAAFLRSRLALGGVPEWLNGAVLKTADGHSVVRGFESLPLR